jgi:heat shock protein HtpX
MQKASSGSLAARAVLAVVLLVGFYALALAIVGGLLWIPYAEWRYLGQLHAKLTVLCVLSAGLVLWAILPRLDRFEAPGPRLTPEQHPRLFALIGEVAAATRQAMPVEVYLVPDLNAWVAQRGGVMGLGSRRVMGIGLPLLQALTERQLRAVLAHEFGHYHGGDTALGPWIYKTRATLGRTLQAVSHSTLLSKPFEWYGNGFLRVTHAISRRQEFVADALAARVAGSDAMTSALIAVHAAGNAFHPFWATEFVPVLRRGFRAPLASGFAAFLAAPGIERAVRASVDQEMASGKSDPYDTHPPLRERVAALTALPAGAAEGGESPALELLGDVERTEQALLAFLMKDGVAASLKPVSWEETVEQVWIPAWREQSAANAGRLRGLTPESLTDHPEPRTWLPLRLGMAASLLHVTDGHRAEAAGIFGSALLTAFHAAGVPIQAPLGAPVTVEVDGTVVRPFDLPADLATGALSREAWRELCARAGIAGLDLGSTAPAPAAA